MEHRPLEMINKDLETVSTMLKLLDKKMIDAKDIQQVEIYKKMILEHEKLFHELENEKVLQTKRLQG